MNVWKLLSILVVGISTSTMAYAQNLDDLDLTKGILALQCSDVDGDVDTPLVFVKGDTGWVLNSSEDVVVTEISDGFRLTRTNDPNWMAFVTGEKSRDWTLRIISDSRIEETTCTNIQDLVEILTATIAPRIVENVSEIHRNMLLADENDRLIAELNSLKQLKGELPNLTAKLEIFQDALDVMLENPTQRMAFEIGAFMQEYGYDMSDQTASDYKFGYVSRGNLYCLSAFEAGNLQTPPFCYELLRKALLPNPD